MGEYEQSNLKSSLLSISPIEQRTWRQNRELLVQELKKQLWLAGPLIAANLLQKFLLTISIMFIGHAGELQLSGASMAVSFAGVTGFSVLMGMGCALDTLCGKAYGAKQYRMLGVQMQRAMFVLLLVSIPLALFWASTEPILMAVGQDASICKEAGIYAQWLIPSLFAYAILQCELRFLQTQNIVLPMMISSGVTLLLHTLVCWALVFKSGLGGKGAALANAISYWINALLLALYIKFSPACQETWTGFSKDAFKDLAKFLRLAIPSSVMVCMEWWSFEMLALMSGLLPNPKLETSVLSISLNTSSLVYMISFGLSGAVSVRVSNELGAGQSQAARLAAFVAVLLAIVEGATMGLALILIRHVWGYSYSNEEEVAQYVSDFMPLLVISTFMDGIQCVLSGTARGCGWQKFGALVNLGAFYVVGIPIAVLLAFVFHVGGQGLWIGIICGSFMQFVLLLAKTISTNWEQEVRETRWGTF